MKLKRLYALLIAMCVIMTGCSDPSDKETDSPSLNQSSTDAPGDSATNQTDSSGSDISGATDASNVTELDVTDMFSNRDYEVGYDENKCAYIELNGTTATCSSNAVQIDSSTITIKDEGTYILSGTLDDGMIIVDADDSDKPQLILNGVTINSETSAPIYILEADKVFITLAENTENTLSNGGTFTAIDENNIDAVIFSKQDVTLNGSGRLTITSPAGHGIECKDDLVFTSGTYSITAAFHGLNANDSVRIANATLTIDAGKDGIQAENTDDATFGFIYVASGTLNIEAEGDGISAASILQIDGGSFTITSGGGSENGTKSSSDNWGGFGGGFGGMGGGRPGSSGSNNSTESTEDSTSMKALKATGNLIINSGTFTIDSADDAVHANGSVTVTGGTFEIATGDDGLHADDTLTINAGTINISESYEGLEALYIYFKDGNVSLVASDDGLNAAGGNDASGTEGGRDDMFGGGPGSMGGFGGMGGSSSKGIIEISGGNLYINASGDGIDANGSLTISGGYTVVCGPTQGDTATLDYDTNAVISGGTFIGTGASGMAQTFSDSENQGVFAVQVGGISAGTEFVLTDAKGNEVISYSPELNYAVIILSCPEIQSGETYTITVGSASGSFEAN